jgi:hypothetical protein
VAAGLSPRLDDEMNQSTVEILTLPADVWMGNNYGPSRSLLTSLSGDSKLLNWTSEFSSGISPDVHQETGVAGIVQFPCVLSDDRGIWKTNGRAHGRPSQQEGTVL